MLTKVRNFCALAWLAMLTAGAMPACAQTITIDGNGESRGQLLAQIVPDGTAEVVWKNPALAGEPVQGHFEGSSLQVLKEILAPADFAAIYADDGGTLKITKLIILDKETAVTGPAQTTPVTEPPPNQALLQQRRLQQQKQLQQQQLLRQRQMQGGQPPRLVNGQMMPPGVNRQRRLPQPGVQPDQ